MNRYALEPAPGRVPPSDLDAEAVVIAASLLEVEALDVVRDTLEPTELYADANQRILQTIFDLHDANKRVDIVSVAGVLRDSGRLDQVGGAPYLAQLCDATPAVANVADHVRRVKEKAKLRSVISVAQRIAAEGYGDVGPVEKWAENCEKRIAEVTAGSSAEAARAVLYGESARAAYEIVKESAKAGASMVGYATGFDELDNHVGGLAAGDLWIIGGYPGIGKTSLVKQTLEYVAQQKTKAGAPVMSGMFSLEMRHEQLTLRALARRSQVPFTNLRVGRMQPWQWQDLVEQCRALAEIPLFIDDRRGLTPFQLRRRLRRIVALLKNKFGSEAELGAFAVDYIQMMEANETTNNRAHDLGTISKALKQLAGEFGCAVLALSSLSRPDKKQKVRAPRMADLRDSGALEFDADVILMVHRDDAFKEKGTAYDNIAELNVDKGRNSGPSRHEYKFDGRYTAFYPLEYEVPAQGPQQEIGYQ